MVAGGLDGLALNASILATAELYDHVTDQWHALPPMHVARTGHAAALLHSGAVLVVGGLTYIRREKSNPNNYTASAEIFDPRASTWTVVGALRSGRAHHSLVTLQSGDVMAVGGISADNALDTAVELFSPRSTLWSPLSPLHYRRMFNDVVVLPSGDVLLVGPSMAESERDCDTELYSIHDNIWKCKNLIVSRLYPLVGLLPNGNVLAVGGYIWPNEGPTSSTELYNSTLGQWTATSAMSFPRNGGLLLVLPHSVLMQGVTEGGGPPTTESYDIEQGVWSLEPPILPPTAFYRVLMLNQSSVMFFMDPPVAFYNPQNRTWKNGASMPRQRLSAAATVTVLGGQQAGLSSTNLAIAVVASTLAVVAFGGIICWFVRSRLQKRSGDAFVPLV